MTNKKHNFCRVMLICMLFALTACTYGKIDLGDGNYS